MLVCSAFIESDFEPLPTDRTSENALYSQLTTTRSMPRWFCFPWI